MTRSHDGAPSRSRWLAVSVADIFMLLGSPATRPSLLLRADTISEPSMSPRADSAPGTPVGPAGGLTIAEFAAWAGVDRRRVSEHLVEIPPGPVLALPPGKVPCRVIGGTRRIFIADFRGDPSSIGVGAGRERSAPAARRELVSSWAGALARLRAVELDGAQGTPELRGGQGRAAVADRHGSISQRRTTRNDGKRK